MRWALAVVVLVGAGLRVHALDSGLWFDEIVTLIESVRAPLTRIVTHFPGNNDHPLYSALAHVSIAAFGEHAWSLRLPALAFGIGALPMLYILGASVTGRFEALSATILLAVSYHHVWFSQNARGYTILLFGALLGTRLLLIGLRDNRRAAYMGYAVVSALGAYTHLTMVLVVLGQAGVVAGHIWAPRARRLERRDWLDPLAGFALAGLLTVMLYAPFLLDVHAFFGRESPGARVATAGWALGETVRGLQRGYAVGSGVVLGGLIFLTGCWSYVRQSPTVLALFLVPGAVLFAGAMLLQRPIFPRFFLFLAGFALLIVVRGALTMVGWIALWLPGRGLEEGYRRLLPIALVGGMAIFSTMALPYGYRYPKQDYEAALRYVEAQVGANDVVAVVGLGTALPYQRYYGRPWRRLAGAADLATTRQGHDTVWLLYTFKSYIETLEADLMSEVLARCTPVRTFPGTIAGGSIVVTKCGAG